MACKSCADSSSLVAPRFSSSRCTFVVPGIGTIQGRLAIMRARIREHGFLVLAWRFLTGEAALYADFDKRFTKRVETFDRRGEILVG